MKKAFLVLYWSVICICLMQHISVNAKRNPFTFGEFIPKLRAIGLIEPQHIRFALIDFKKKCYKVMEGDIFLHYQVSAIEKQSIVLQDLKNKKALQLKIS